MKKEIDDEELLVFYLCSTGTLFPIPHQDYPLFNLYRYSTEECIHSFRFGKPKLNIWQQHYDYQTALSAKIYKSIECVIFQNPWV